MSRKGKIITTSIWLVITFIVFVYAFVSKAIVIGENGLQLYPNGPNWICIVGFAVISFPSVFDILKMIKRSIKKSNRYYDEHQVATVIEHEHSTEIVSINKKYFENFLSVLFPIVAAGALIYFFGFFAAIGFTLYRIGVLIYCIVKIRKENKEDQLSSSSYNGTPSSADSSYTPYINAHNGQNSTISLLHSSRDPEFTRDYENDFMTRMFCRRSIFAKVSDPIMGHDVAISLDDMMLFDSPSSPDFFAEWVLPLDNGQKIEILRQGLDLDLGKDKYFKQILYVTKVMTDCPSVNKRRGDLAFFLLTYAVPGNTLRFNLMLLENSAENIAYDYLLKTVPEPDAVPIYSKGLYPILMADGNNTFFSLLPLDTATYEGKEYLLAQLYETLPNYPKDDYYVLEIVKDHENRFERLSALNIEFANTIYNHCFRIATDMDERPKSTRVNSKAISFRTRLGLLMQIAAFGLAFLCSALLLIAPIFKVNFQANESDAHYIEELSDYMTFAQGIEETHAANASEKINITKKYETLREQLNEIQTTNTVTYKNNLLFSVVRCFELQDLSQKMSRYQTACKKAETTVKTDTLELLKLEWQEDTFSELNVHTIALYFSVFREFDFSLQSIILPLIVFVIFIIIPFIPLLRNTKKAFSSIKELGLKSWTYLHLSFLRYGASFLLLVLTFIPLFFVSFSILSKWNIFAHICEGTLLVILLAAIGYALYLLGLVIKKNSAAQFKYIFVMYGSLTLRLVFMLLFILGVYISTQYAMSYHTTSPDVGYIQMAIPYSLFFAFLLLIFSICSSMETADHMKEVEHSIATGRMKDVFVKKKYITLLVFLYFVPAVLCGFFDVFLYVNNAISLYAMIAAIALMAVSAVMLLIMTILPMRLRTGAFIGITYAEIDRVFLSIPEAEAYEYADNPSTDVKLPN